MKIAIIGANRKDSMEYNLMDAFQFAGHECSIFDFYELSVLFSMRCVSIYAKTLDKLARSYSDSYDKKVFSRLARKVNNYDPDLIICVYRFIHPCFVSSVKKQNRRVIHINPDQMTTLEYQQIFASNYDAWFTKDLYMQHFMKDNMKLNVYHYNEAFNKRYHTKPNCSKIECEKEVGIDVMTYGTIYPYRAKMLNEVVKAGINLKIFGVLPHRFYDHSLDEQFQNRYITGEEKSKILYGSKIVFNQMHYAEIEGVNCRFFEVNGSGAFQLSDYRPILKEILPIDPSLVSFKSIDEGIDKIKYYLVHDDERFEIASIIFNHFLNKYSYDNLVSYILDVAHTL